MTINIVLPHVARKPGGGTKVMYEYANNLSLLGHQVTVYTCMETSFFKASKVKNILRKIYFSFFTYPSWFNFHTSVKKKIIYRLSNDTIADADIIMTTGWSITYDLQNISLSKGKKVNLIQDLEFWTGNKEDIHQSYKFDNILKITYSKHIAKYIQNIRPDRVEKVNISVDRNKFKIEIPIQNRNPHSLCMMYSLEERKGSKIGYNALLKLKEQFPSLVVQLFGVPNEPLPKLEWIKYHQVPKNIPEIMNESAIFLTPSIWEGYGIPGIEAMFCGCAVVCSDAEGHSDYAFDDDTAIVFKAGSENEVIDALTKILSNDDFRLQLAKRGNEFINKKMNWLESAEHLADIFQSLRADKIRSID